MKKQEIKKNEELVEAFIGTKYNEFKAQTFNIGAFLAGPYYLFYRKMVLYAIITIIIEFILGVLIPYASIFIGLLLGFVANKIYLDFAKNKVAKIKITYPNKNMTELKELCKLKGGPSSAILITSIFATFACMVALMMLLATIATYLLYGTIPSINPLSSETYIINYDDEYTPGNNYKIYVSNDVDVFAEHFCSYVGCQTRTENYSIDYSRSTMNSLKKFLRDNFNSSVITVTPKDLTSYQENVIRAIVSKDEQSLIKALNNDYGEDSDIPLSTAFLNYFQA